MKEIRNNKLRSELERLGLGHIHLIKGEGYFYIVSDKEIYNETDIYLNSFGQQSVEEWIKDIVNLINK